MKYLIIASLLFSFGIFAQDIQEMTGSFEGEAENTRSSQDTEQSEVTFSPEEESSARAPASDTQEQEQEHVTELTGTFR
jgi:hypothetical protein